MPLIYTNCWSLEIVSTVCLISEQLVSVKFTGFVVKQRSGVRKFLR